MKPTLRSTVHSSVCKSHRFSRRRYGTAANLDLRDHFQSLESTLGIRRLDDWYTIKWQDAIKASESPLLRAHFNGSLYAALKAAYPEHNWLPWKFSSLPRTFWTDEKNQRDYLEWLKDQLGLQSLEDWYHVTKKDIYSRGGARFAALFKSGGLFKILQKLYPSYEWLPWKVEKCPNGFWQDMNNQRAYMDWLGKKLGYITLDDWYKVTKSDFLTNHGASILKQHDETAFNVLKAVYKEHEWVPWKMRTVPRGTWTDVKNHRYFMDSVAQQLNINTLDDWYKVSTNQVLQMGAVGLFGNYYNNSLFLALKKVYPEHDWKPWKFERLPYKVFSNLSYVRAFLDESSEKLSITHFTDWYRVSHEQLFALGGRPLLELYGSLYTVLELSYPDYKWDISKFIGHPGKKKSGQRWLRICVQELFPKEGTVLFVLDSRSTEVVEEYTERKLTFPSSSRPMELDVYVPNLKLAFEFQGQQHYHDTFVFGALDRYKARDLEKKEGCKKAQITLIEVPYFWDRTKDSLKAMILKERPDIFQL